MQATVIHSLSDYTSLQLETKPIPVAVGNNVVVQIYAASINPVDGKIIKYGFWPTPMPFYPGYDAAGVVTSLASDYNGGDLKVGDAVFTCNWGNGRHNDEEDPTNSLGGAFAEYALFPAHKIAKIPSGLSYESAAALALVGLTAYQAVYDVLKLNAGQKVLVLGGAGAVGSIAIQLAKLLGCYVATTASSRNANYVKQFNPDKIVDYTISKWWEDSELVGIEAILDAVGEAEVFQHSCLHNVVKKGGAFASIVSALKDFTPLDAAEYSITNFVLRHSQSQLDILADLMLTGKLVVPIEERFEFNIEGIHKLYQKQNGGKSNGKNILIIKK